LKAARYWLMSAACCAVALAAPPPSAPPSGQRSSPVPVVSGMEAPDGRTARAATPGAGPPNDDFIEFLGADDVEDAAWWEFLKKSAPRKDQPPVTPPQDSKQ
jgi:hypothetical protein